MKTRSTILCLLFLFSLGSFAQKKKVKGNGNIKTEKRTVGEFDNIAVSGSFNVILKKGKEGPVTVEASDNLLEVIESEVEKDVLKIKFKSGFNIYNTKKVNITVTVEEVSKIALSGSGSISTDSELIAKELSVALSGSGKIKLNVFTDVLEAKMSGSGSISFKGETNQLECGLSGSGRINASELKSAITTAKLSGSGAIKVQASKEIYANTSGSGKIVYAGDPEIVKANSSGSGSVKKM